MNKEFPLYSFTPTERFIIEKLVGRVLAAKELALLYEQSFKNSPKKSVYKAITALKEKEVIAGDKNSLSLSIPWLSKISTIIDIAQGRTDPVLELKEKESLTYIFPNFDTCDLFSDHIHRIIQPRLDTAIPLVIHNPHQWFYVTRFEQEVECWSEHANADTLCLMSVAGKTKLDIEFGNKFFAQHKLLNFSVSDELAPHTVYTLVLGDLIYTVTIEKWRADAIDNWFKKYTSVTNENKLEMEKITTKKGTIKLKFIRDSKKAIAWRKKIGKYFLIPKGYRLE